jgi:hypothetical protein
MYTIWLFIVDSRTEDIAELVKQMENDLEMIRFCSSGNKQQDEALDVVNTLLEKLNIT